MTTSNVTNVMMMVHDGRRKKLITSGRLVSAEVEKNYDDDRGLSLLI